ncbi:FecR domain-containing protein [Brevundimonas sp.]|uniref:FecR family protein n=1 Tax=Brevundimonas sp. TaxID=1871086 RepID=UPI002737F948|nr:FecR domain-containing protein [Brevundimonas sp.]MDP3801196.1 FecR domain-containing protein [Brevundimonas sp.]
MTNPKVRVETADTEAAAWHARLGARNVSTGAIEDFFTWRAKPANAEAYRRVEKIWADTGKVADDPEIARALEAAMSRKAGAASSRGVPRTLLGLAAVGAAAALAIGAWAWQQSRTVFVTGVGEQRLVQLADGSSIRLDTASRIRVRFADDRRLVDLERGQALFTVAHDRDRPFIVDAGATQVTAVGTVFDVRRDGATVSVTLVSGAVDVAPGEGRAAQRMAAGQHAKVTSGGVATRIADVPAETSWTDGRIVFRDTPLRQAVSEVNRYLTAKIELDATSLDAVPVNGVFRTGDRDAFVSTASQVFDLEASPGPDGSVRLTARKNN